MISVLSKLTLTLALLLGAAYSAACLFLYLRQTRMIFFPVAAIDTTPADFGVAYEEVWLPLPTHPAERLHGWWIPAPASTEPANVLLYLHGNGVNIGANAAHAHRFHQMGMAVLLMDYRGYGQSRGNFPSEAAVYEDAEAMWHYLVEQRRVAPEQIFIYGHSLGGAIAIELATQHPDAAGLIVQSSFTSIRAMVDRTMNLRWIPIDLILTQRFDSLRKVPTLEVPVLFIHGTADAEVPADMSQRLYNAAPDPKHLWLVPTAGHNNVADTSGMEYFQRVMDLLGRRRG
ncbi:MAG: alpha/beta hydrolase [Leptolyngbyaceae cyanobacterium SL_7_1]|nr:alpha/beta hydrolase [Leptolyngbyaceae cyanobacterium SL_7_1]